MKIAFIPIALLLASAVSVWAQEDDPPIPRLANGTISLAPAEGDVGMWTPAGLVQLAANPNATNGLNSLPENMDIDEVPFKPWARALYDYRQANFEKDDPHTRCNPSSGPRQFMTPYGNEFVQLPELGMILLTDVGGAHSYRIIDMTADSHPEELVPSYFGHSIGRWEGDTLVVDTVGYNEKFWFNREGAPHTEDMHLIERFTREAYRSMRYEVTIEDPGVYTEPWTGAFMLNWSPYEAWEYICQDNNLSESAMVGVEGEGGASRTSRIVP